MPPMPRDRNNFEQHFSIPPRREENAVNRVGSAGNGFISRLDAHQVNGMMKIRAATNGFSILLLNRGKKVDTTHSASQAGDPHSFVRDPAAKFESFFELQPRRAATPSKPILKRESTIDRPPSNIGLHCG
jgi:hypothetical protein